jgi:hypothetical protein
MHLAVICDRSAAILKNYSCYQLRCTISTIAMVDKQSNSFCLSRKPSAEGKLESSWSVRPHREKECCYDCITRGATGVGQSWRLETRIRLGGDARVQQALAREEGV